MIDARRALRTGTHAAHARVDAIFSCADLSDRKSYLNFLVAQAAAFIPVESALEAAGASAQLTDWPARRRSELLRADLRALGVTDQQPMAAPLFASAAETWGGLYVLEGSRLGGALLGRSVAPGFPTAFLGAAPAPGAWRSFLHQLNDNVAGEEEIALAVAAAERVFGLFEEAGTRFL